MKQNSIAIDKATTTPTTLRTIASTGGFNFSAFSKMAVWVGMGEDVEVAMTDFATSAVPTNTGDTLMVAAFPVVANPTGAPPALESNMS
jgi:hypothetical protein